MQQTTSVPVTEQDILAPLVELNVEEKIPATTPTGVTNTSNKAEVSQDIFLALRNLSLELNIGGRNPSTPLPPKLITIIEKAFGCEICPKHRMSIGMSLSYNEKIRLSILLKNLAIALERYYNNVENFTLCETFQMQGLNIVIGYSDVGEIFESLRLLGPLPEIPEFTPDMKRVGREDGGSEIVIVDEERFAEENHPEEQKSIRVVVVYDTYHSEYFYSRFGKTINGERYSFKGQKGMGLKDIFENVKIEIQKQKEYKEALERMKECGKSFDHIFNDEQELNEALDHMFNDEL